MTDNPEVQSTLFSCRADLVRIGERIALLHRYPEVVEAAGILLPAVEHARILVDLLFPKMRVEIALEELVAAGDWEQLSDVLGRPLPDLTALLSACQGRLAYCRPHNRAPWARIRDKLVKARRLAVTPGGTRGFDRWPSAAGSEGGDR